MHCLGNFIVGAKAVIAKADAQGCIWLVDRKKDVIITDGENVYPVEVDNFLQSHPKIQDMAVIGLPSLRLGEIATAVIQVKPDQSLTKNEVRAFCEPLARDKRPRNVYFDDVPRNPNGKIERHRLRQNSQAQRRASELSSSDNYNGKSTAPALQHWGI